MKTVLVVGAGRYQRSVIRRARELGLRVVAVDRNPDAPGLGMADVPRVVDFASPDAVLEQVRELGIDGVLTVQAERAVPMVAALAESLELPGIGVDAARLLTNKLAMRTRLAEAGLPQPRFATVRTAEEARRAATEIGFPAVLKPADSAGQVGLARIMSADDAEESLPGAVAASPSGEAVLEEYVEGTELNGIVVVQEGDVLATVLCDRLRPPGRGFGVSWLHVYPPSVAGDRRAEAERVAADAVRALGLETGIGFPQLIAKPTGGVALVECAARIGGMMAEHLRHALGIDLLEVALRLSLGEQVTLGGPAPAVRAAGGDPLPHCRARHPDDGPRDARRPARRRPGVARRAGRGGVRGGGRDDQAGDDHLRPSRLRDRDRRDARRGRRAGRRGHRARRHRG